MLMLESISPNYLDEQFTVHLWPKEICISSLGRNKTLWTLLKTQNVCSQYLSPIGRRKAHPEYTRRRGQQRESRKFQNGITVQCWKGTEEINDQSHER